MARARNIKPGFFTNDDLVDLPFEVRILFIGLWTIADKEGRLPDRPKKIKMEIFPADDVDCHKALSSLEGKNFIRRYQINGVGYIQIMNWAKHQNPHIKETPSVIPEENNIAQEIPVLAQEIPVLAQEFPGLAQNNPERAGLIPDSLIPDSLIPDSLIPDSNQPKSKTLQPALPVAEKKTGVGLSEQVQKVCRETWQAYADAYFTRYGTEPVRNQKTNRNVIDFCKRVSMQEAPDIARWYVSHSDAYYVRQMHAFGLLLKDAEKVRTEWATGQRMTQTKAKQTDRAGNTASVVTEIMAERRAVA